MVLSVSVSPDEHRLPGNHCTRAGCVSAEHDHLLAWLLGSRGYCISRCRELGASQLRYCSYFERALTQPPPPTASILLRHVLFSSLEAIPTRTSGLPQVLCWPDLPGLHVVEAQGSQATHQICRSHVSTLHLMSGDANHCAVVSATGTELQCQPSD